MDALIQLQQMKDDATRMENKLILEALKSAPVARVMDLLRLSLPVTVRNLGYQAWVDKEPLYTVHLTATYASNADDSHEVLMNMIWNYKQGIHRELGIRCAAATYMGSGRNYFFKFGHPNKSFMEALYYTLKVEEGD